jgi:alpha-D-ribose 1-methylphosphonate 5-triphosphate synthase subunit PhnL
MRLLEVEHYTKRFEIHHLGRQIEAFSSLSFSLDRGQFLLVSGANGSGKSTLLRCLYRTYLPSDGQALYHSLHGPIDLARAADVDIAVLRRDELGFVTQFLRPRPRVSAVELVAEPLLASGMSMAEAEQKAREMLDAFGLKVDLWMAYPTTFSGGEQQKVNLARALIRPRRLLLLDEPTASLDAQTRTALVNQLAWLKEQGVAMLGVFHHPDDVRSLVDAEISLAEVAGAEAYQPVTEDVYVAE